MPMRGSYEGEYEYHINLLLDDGRHVQVNKSYVRSLGEGRYELKPGARPHVFTEKVKPS